MLASIGTISLPVHLADYRERGVLRRFRASGLPEWAMLASQSLVSIAIAVVGTILLCALGAAGFGVRFPASFGALALAFIVGSFCFAAIGMLLASLVRTARAAQAVGLLLWFVMMFLGTGAPLNFLPGNLLFVGKGLPLYHAVVPLVDAWNGYGINTTQILVLAVIGLAATLATLKVFRWGVSGWERRAGRPRDLRLLCGS